MSYDQSQVAFVDTETWGLDPEWHAVWEVAVIVDGVEHCWQQRSNSFNHSTGLPLGIDPYVLEHRDEFGLDRYDHQTALPWRESLLRFVDLVNGRHLVGACHWFDSERMHRLWLQHARIDEDGYHRQPQWTSAQRQHPWHYHLIDVEALIIGYLACRRAKDHFGHLVPANDDINFLGVRLPWSSTELSKALGVDPDDFLPKHSALTDTRWAKAVYETIMGQPVAGGATIEA